MLRRSWVGLAMLMVAATMSGCGFPTQERANGIATNDLPDDLRPGATTPPAILEQSEAVVIWFVRERQLEERRHFVARPATVESVGAELLEGPTTSEQEAGLRTALPDDDVVVAVQLSRGTAVVELATEFRGISPEDQVLAVAQIVLTLTDFRGVGAVEFVVDGEAIAVPVPDGETTDQPVVREQYIGVASADTS